MNSLNLFPLPPTHISFSRPVLVLAGGFGITCESQTQVVTSVWTVCFWVAGLLDHMPFYSSFLQY